MRSLTAPRRVISRLDSEIVKTEKPRSMQAAVLQNETNFARKNNGEARIPATLTTIASIALVDENGCTDLALRGVDDEARFAGA